MKRVANRKVISKLSWRTMREKREKNLIAILAIALTALLFTAVFTVGSTLVRAIEESTMRQIGTSAHGGFKTLTLEEYERIKEAGGCRDISYDIFAGFAMNPELAAIQTEVRYAEDDLARWSFCYPEEGRMPAQGKECVASSKVLDALGIPMELGVRVPITLRTHDAEGQEKYIVEEFVLSGYYFSNDAAHAQEFWVSQEWLYENIDISSKTYRERSEQGNINQEGLCQVQVWFDSAYDIETQVHELAMRAGFAEGEIEESVNWAYTASEVDGFTMMMMAGILFIITLAGYLIIYNIFYINVTSDIRYYGLLKTIGTTGRQLRGMVHRQALLLSAAGIPLGLFLGWFVGKGIIPVMYRIMNLGNIMTPVSLNPSIFAGSAVFALAVVYLSSIRPCRLAAKVSAIEAVRYVESTQYRRKEKRTARVSALRLAMANMGRNRKKAAVVIASLSLSLVLLNGTYCLVKGFSFDEYVKSYLISDMQLTHACTVNMSYSYHDFEAFTPAIVEELSAIDGVTKIRSVWSKCGELELSGEVLERFERIYREKLTDKPYLSQEVEESLSEKVARADCFSAEEELFSCLEVTQGNLDEEMLKAGGYGVLLTWNDEDWLSLGDQIALGYYNYRTGQWDTKKEIRIMAVARLSDGAGTRHYPGVGTRIFLGEKDFHELFETQGALHACLTVEEEKTAQISQAIERLISERNPELTLITKESLKKEFSDLNRVFTVVGGLLGAVLGFIGVLNLINAMITGILARKQEFAMMQAVGMTGKQLEGMLIMEGIWYGIFTLAITATVGNGISWGLVWLIGRNMNYFVWKIRFLPLIASVPVIAAVVVALPVICYHVLCKKSIIERLRVAEV